METKADQIEKSKGGRPPKFANNKELQDAIHDYFLNGVAKRSIVAGKPPNQQVIQIEIPTITGLCYYIGFESRQSFYDLEKNDEFSYTIKRARLFIEKEYEEQLTAGNTTGGIFALKNMGWTDKQSVDHSSEDGSMSPTRSDLSKLSKETLKNIESDLDA